MNRYHRQTLLPQIREAGQRKLGEASVLIVGVGALGTVLAESLVRAGVGRVTLADRDVVEETNLQRQTLFAEADVGQPKAVAAMARLAEINRHVELDAKVVDVAADNIERLAAGATLLLDGTDNAATRYLINDVAVKHGVSWVYGGCVGTEGRVMPVLCGTGFQPVSSSAEHGLKTYATGCPCLRCVFPEPPTAGEVDTCDTVGVLGPAVGLVANAQATAAIRLMVGDGPVPKLLTIDAWNWRFREIDLTDARRADCPACGLGRYDFLNTAAAQTASLCGRDSVQVRTHVAADFSLDRVEAALARRFELTRTTYLLKAAVEPGIELTLFADGRVLVHGTSDASRARAIVSRYLG